MPIQIKNTASVIDNSSFPPEIFLSNEVVTTIEFPNSIPRIIRYKCKNMKNICGYVSTCEFYNPVCTRKCIRIYNCNKIYKRICCLIKKCIK